MPGSMDEPPANAPGPAEGDGNPGASLPGVNRAGAGKESRSNLANPTISVQASSAMPATPREPHGISARPVDVGRSGNDARRLSEEIGLLVAAFAERSVTLREVMSVLRGRAYTLLLILMALPFCTPIPLPGLSLPFGLAIAVIGFRLALGQTPWLPARLLDTRMPPRFFGRLLGAAWRLIRMLETVLRPRWIWLVRSRPMHPLTGAVLCVSGLLMLLPLPIPFSNGLPALTVVLIASALLEDDGYCLMAGGVAFLASLAYFGLLTFGGAELAGWLRDVFGGWLHDPE